MVPAWPLSGRGICCPDVFPLMSSNLVSLLRGRGRPAEEPGKNSRAEIVESLRKGMGASQAM